MKKQMLSLLSLFSVLNGMDTPVVETPKTIYPKHFDMWEFFSEPNHLDKLDEPRLVWNKKQAKEDYSIHTLANLHILQKSKLQTSRKLILDMECKRGHISAFLAQDADTVYGYDTNPNNIHQANKKYNLRNLMFCDNLRYIVKENFYDLIVSCAPSADMEKLQVIRALLKPKGEIFCLFTTRSNIMPIEVEVFRELLPKIKKCVFSYEQRHLQTLINEENKKYPIDEDLKNMIAQAGFDIITFEQKNFNILIQDLDTFKSFHKPLIMALPCMPLIYNQKKREIIANTFMGKIIGKLKKDASGNWFYPCNKIIVHIKKTD